MNHLFGFLASICFDRNIEHVLGLFCIIISDEFGLNAKQCESATFQNYTEDAVLVSLKFILTSHINSGNLIRFVYFCIHHKLIQTNTISALSKDFTTDFLVFDCLNTKLLNLNTCLNTNALVKQSGDKHFLTLDLQFTDQK